MSSIKVDQLLDLAGIPHKFGVIDSDYSTPGYIEFDDGLIIQWGTARGTVNLPVTFPNAVLWAADTVNTTSSSNIETRLRVNSTSQINVNNLGGHAMFWIVGGH